MVRQLKNSIIRRVARSYLLKHIDGYKKEIGRILLGCQMIVLALAQIFPDGAIAQELAGYVNEVFLIVAWLGLEFGIQDEEAKDEISRH
jgi:hypothetical protein